MRHSSPATLSAAALVIAGLLLPRVAAAQTIPANMEDTKDTKAAAKIDSLGSSTATGLATTRDGDHGYEEFRGWFHRG